MADYPKIPQPTTRILILRLKSDESSITVKSKVCFTKSHVIIYSGPYATIEPPEMLIYCIVMESRKTYILETPNREQFPFKTS